MINKKHKTIIICSFLVIAILIIYLIINLNQKSNQVIEYTLQVDNLKNENVNTKSKLTKENSILKDEVEQLRKENKKLLDLVDKYENGAPKLLAEIKNAFKQKKYSEVKSLYEVLLKYHPEKEETNKANEIIKQIKVIEEKEKQKIEEEEERKRIEAEKTAKEKARGILRISSVYPSKPNSAGGVDLYIKGQNKSKKEIKYIYFDVVAYNAVKDKVSCEIRGTTGFRGRETGPIKSGKWFGTNTYWECAWYNSTIKSVTIEKIEIDYMDGTSIELTGKDIGYIIY